MNITKHFKRNKRLIKSMIVILLMAILVVSNAIKWSSTDKNLTSILTMKGTQIIKFM